ncbi:hypothetical protein [Acinetobacter seifertii]|uniref:hypothetical protein n=1 Tax=Acinetobacter seifertii TaxID=1530123 RepID=UPI0032B6277A
MAFRADEAAKDGQLSAEKYLLSRLTDISSHDLTKSREKLLDLFDELGPVVYTYPSWHPLVSDKRVNYDLLAPNKECGYQGLDHNVFFANGFITCPYDDGQKVIDSVLQLRPREIANITAERLDVKFYSSSATPILVKCVWQKNLCEDGTIPAAIAVPLLLENELPNWKTAQVGETWDSMSSYFLGKPHGKRSSLFVNQETGQTMKKIWESLTKTGMFGPIIVRP